MITKLRIPTQDQNFGMKMRKYSRKHGMYGTPTYFVWIRMRNRCLGKGGRDYPMWGGRGITICKEWSTFSGFYADMGDKPSKNHSLDRIDNSKGYSKENCRWATWEEQENNRRGNKSWTFNGRTLNQSQWAREVGIRFDTLSYRLRNGWDISRALTQKVK